MFYPIQRHIDNAKMHHVPSISFQKQLAQSCPLPRRTTHANKDVSRRVVDRQRTKVSHVDNNAMTNKKDLEP